MAEAVERLREIKPLCVLAQGSQEIVGTQSVKYYTDDTVSVDIKLSEKWAHLMRNYSVVVNLYPNFVVKTYNVGFFEDNIVRGED